MCGGRLPVPCHTDCDVSAPELVTCSWCELPVAVATDSNRRRWKSKNENRLVTAKDSSQSAENS